MDDRRQDIDWLIELLRATTTVRNPNINLETELYYELRLSGDCIDDVIAAASRRCGLALDIDTRRHSPGEPGDWFDWLFKAPSRRRYESLTVSKLLTAMLRSQS
ncbi:hypothetical protein [Phenylobacterium sp.]|uniref:hypothetical protein n=1 Tax=Phenylobacterium sp. TaxID=1871053 RepID=UPI00286A518B|nr:hypothetical protein [Phenylobacterium sp.]